MFNKILLLCLLGTFALGWRFQRATRDNWRVRPFWQVAAVGVVEAIIGWLIFPAHVPRTFAGFGFFRSLFAVLLLSFAVSRILHWVGRFRPLARAGERVSWLLGWRKRMFEASFRRHYVATFKATTGEAPSPEHLERAVRLGTIAEDALGGIESQTEQIDPEAIPQGNQAQRG